MLAAAFGAGVIDAMAGGGGLVQLPALFAAYPSTPHPTLLGTGKLAGFAGTTSAIFRFIRHVRIAWRLLSVRASRNSSQAFTNERIAAVNTPGPASGMTTRQRAPIREQPSAIAAFSRSAGMSWKKLAMTRVQTGMLRTV